LNETCLWLLEELVEEEEEAEVEDEVERMLLDLFVLQERTLMFDQKLKKVDFHLSAKLHNYVYLMVTLLVMEFARNLAEVALDGCSAEI
jgi:hypothetical protein